MATLERRENDLGTSPRVVWLIPRRAGWISSLYGANLTAKANNLCFQPPKKVGHKKRPCCCFSKRMCVLFFRFVFFPPHKGNMNVTACPVKTTLTTTTTTTTTTAVLGVGWGALVFCVRRFRIGLLFMVSLCTVSYIRKAVLSPISDLRKLTGAAIGATVYYSYEPVQKRYCCLFLTLEKLPELQSEPLLLVLLVRAGLAERKTLCFLPD